MMRFIFALLLLSTGANATTNTIVTSAPPVQGLVAATDTSAGAADAAKVPLLNPLGYIDLTMLAALSGDCTTPGGSGVLTCTKTNGVAFGVGATATVIPPAWLGTTSTTALAGNTAFVPLSAVYPVESYGAVCDGITDDSVAVQAAITAAQSTGGTVLFPSKTCRINSQLTIPNDGASTLAHQRPIRLQGFGSHMNGSGAQAPYGGTVLDLRSSAVDGKLVSYGLGLLEIRDITFYDGGTNTNPYLFATNTTVHIYDNAFIGNPPKNGTTCDQDAIVLGGTAHTFGNTPADSFQGYGTVISHNAFDRIRRAIYFKVDTNANVIEGNTVYSNSGTALAGGAAIDLDGGVYTSTGNYIAGNLIELPHYIYGIKLANGSANTVVGNDCFDAGGSTVACVRIETTSTRNLITGSLAGGVPAIYLSDASSNTGGNEYLSTDQGHPSYLGPANTFDDAGNQPWTFANVAFQGGDTKTTIQPSAAQVPGTIQLQLKRSAAEGSSPSGKVFELDYNGDTKWFSGASVQNGSFTSTGTTWTSASGNLTLTPSSAVVDTGRFSIGGSGNTNAAFSLVNSPTSSQPVWISANGTLDSTLTNTFTGVAINPSTPASSYTLGVIRNFTSAFNTLGASSAVTSIYGYYADSTLANAGATNTWGFYSNVASSSGSFNFYANGTAPNYFNGEVRIQSTSGSLNGQLAVAGNATGGVNRYGVYENQAIQSDVTSEYRGLYVGNSTQATAFTLANYSGVRVTNPTVGAGSTITNIRSFYADNVTSSPTFTASFASEMASGTGKWAFYGNGTAASYLGGSLTIGSNATPTQYTLRASKNITGNVNMFPVAEDGTIQSDVTGTVENFRSASGTVASAFTLATLVGFDAAQGTIGSGSAVTTQAGFRAESGLTGATNNYGFECDIASGANRFCFWANGTAANYFNGEVQTSSDVLIKGTAGAGYLELDTQSSAPATPPTNDIRLYSDASGRFAWIGSNGFTRVLDGTANTANRVYTLPDVAGTMLNTGNVPNILTTTGALKGAAGSISQAAASDLSNGTTGTAGSTVVLSDSPTITGTSVVGNLFHNGYLRLLKKNIADTSPTLTGTDGAVFAYTSISAARTITFATNGNATGPQVYIFKDESGSAGATNTISLSGPTIDGAASPQVIINAAFGVRILYCTSSTICFKVL